LHAEWYTVIVTGVNKNYLCDVLCITKFMYNQNIGILRDFIFSHRYC